MEIPDLNSKDITITKKTTREIGGVRISQRFTQGQIPQIPTPEQLYLRDEDNFFQTTSIKLTPFFEILQRTQAIQNKLTNSY